MRFIALAVPLVIACRSPERSTPSVSADASVVVAEASAPVAEADAMPEPVSSVRLAEPPDVRVMLPATSTSAVVKVGQIFGIFVPFEQDFLDEWELQADCPLGEPLTFIAREGGRELLWKIDGARVGTHDVFVVLMHRATRTSLAKPKRRAKVTVQVLP